MEVELAEFVELRRETLEKAVESQNPAAREQDPALFGVRRDSVSSMVPGEPYQILFHINVPPLRRCCPIFYHYYLIAIIRRIGSSAFFLRASGTVISYCIFSRASRTVSRLL